MAQQQPARRKMQMSKAPISIPDKLYFRIGDVSRLCSLPAYVLRFWETEFPQLKPNKGGTGQRLYRKRDVEMVLEIKRLLYEEGFTIAGARRILSDNRKTGAPVARSAVPAQMENAASAAKNSGTSRNRAAAASATGTKVSPTPAAKGPRISALRQEMREILSLLGAENQERAPAESSAKRAATKKTLTRDEPTLF
jgi:DNA-binding transcriptional MerR regulator